VEQFSTTMHRLLTLADRLKAYGVTHVAMEATRVYWKPVWAGPGGPLRMHRARAAGKRRSGRTGKGSKWLRGT
jgi:hypothetical protein